MTKEQLELYKLWLDDYDFSRMYDLSDFLVLLLSFDKVETVMRRCITTNDQPHIRFYNYYLMDWYIKHLTPMKYNKQINKFEHDEKEDWLIRYNEDRRVAEEIDEIKAKVLKKDRPLFFK